MNNNLFCISTESEFVRRHKNERLYKRQTYFKIK